MIRGAKERALRHLAYRYHLRNKKRSAEENWKKAEGFLRKLDKRILKYYLPTEIHERNNNGTKI
jgi:hypothetical protein